MKEDNAYCAVQLFTFIGMVSGSGCKLSTYNKDWLVDQVVSNLLQEGFVSGKVYQIKWVALIISCNFEYSQALYCI